MSTTMPLVQPTPDSTRDELEVAMSHLCIEAVAERRRGHAGVYGRRYADLHDTINGLLDGWRVAH
jgi:hypothetical protein